MPADPDMVGTVLRRVLKILLQRKRNHIRALGFMVSSRYISLPLRSSGIMRTCCTVLICHPRMTFCVLQVASPLQIFVSDIGSTHAVSSSVLVRKILSMVLKICRIICHFSTGLPCNIPMNSSR